MADVKSQTEEKGNNCKEGNRAMLNPDGQRKVSQSKKGLKSERQQKFIRKLLESNDGEQKLDKIQLSNNTPKNLTELSPSQGGFSLNTKILQSTTRSKHKFELRLVKVDLDDPCFLSSLQFWMTRCFFHYFEPLTLVFLYVFHESICIALNF